MGTPGAASEPLATRKEQVCALCRTRECCSGFGVPVGGQDVRRISAGLALPPLAFCQAVLVDGEGFRLEVGGERYRIELRRSEDAQADEPDRAGACLFLLELPGGYLRCGLGALQPTLCRAFPLALDPLGSLTCYEGPGCCRLWSPLDVDPVADRALALSAHREMQAVQAAVETWNQRLEQLPGPASLGELLDFLRELPAGGDDDPGSTAAGGERGAEPST